MKPPSAFPSLHWRDLWSRPGGAWASLPRSGDVQFTFNGRGAIYQSLELMRRSGELGAGRNVVLAPAFHCPTVVDPVLHADFSVRFYAVNEDLSIAAEDFARKLDDGVAAAIFIRYFGISEAPLHLYSHCRALGVRTIEDNCHSFLEANPLALAHSEADVSIYSFWKLAPTLTGGGMLLNTTKNEGVQQKGPSLSDSWSRARRMSEELLQKSSDSLLRGIRVRPVRAAEPPIRAIRRPSGEAYPYDRESSCWRIASSAKWILTRTDLESVARKRRSNYEAFCDELTTGNELALLWPTLPERSCPWGVPLRISNRGERDYLIRDRGVPVFTFGEVLHPALFSSHAHEKEMLDVSRHLSDSILGVAIHQDLSVDQVVGYAHTINEFMSEVVR